MRYLENPPSRGDSSIDLEFRLRLAGERLRAAQQEKLEATLEFLAVRKRLEGILSDATEEFVNSPSDNPHL